MCILRALFFAAMMAILSAAQGVTTRDDIGAGIDPNGAVVEGGSCIDPQGGCAQVDAGVRMDDNG